MGGWHLRRCRGTFTTSTLWQAFHCTPMRFRVAKLSSVSQRIGNRFGRLLANKPVHRHSLDGRKSVYLVLELTIFAARQGGDRILADGGRALLARNGIRFALRAPRARRLSIRAREARGRCARPRFPDRWSVNPLFSDSCSCTHCPSILFFFYQHDETSTNNCGLLDHRCAGDRAANVVSLSPSQRPAAVDQRSRSNTRLRDPACASVGRRDGCRAWLRGDVVSFEGRRLDGTGLPNVWARPGPR